MPRIPRSADGRPHGAARDACSPASHDRLRAWQDGDGPMLEMTHVAPGRSAWRNQMLGECEVSIRIRGPRAGAHSGNPSSPALWRVQEHDETGRVVRDRLMACPISALVTHAGGQAARPPRTVPRVTVRRGARCVLQRRSACASDTSNAHRMS